MLVRRLLEPPAMPLAVAWATAADFAEMDRCLAGGDRAASYEEFETWDLALHRSIFAATHSPLLVTLYSSIETARHGHIWVISSAAALPPRAGTSIRMITIRSSPRSRPGTQLPRCGDAGPPRARVGPPQCHRPGRRNLALGRCPRRPG